MTAPFDADPGVPLVLLPVRLETRVVAHPTSTARRTLRVRILPDEIHVDALDRAVSDAEYAAATAWWTAAWPGPFVGADAAAAAWAQLVAVAGSARAEWVAAWCTPFNLADRGPASVPGFPLAPEPRPPWAGPVARALPDRFVVSAVQSGVWATAVGRDIPPELPVLPWPVGDVAMTTSPTGLTVPEAAAWTVHFQAAVDVGLAVELDVAAGSIDTVVAVGVRSGSPEQGAELVEDLLTGHRYGSGLALLPQGVPTNNSDAARSPYRPARPAEPPWVGVRPVDPASDTAAAARVLGVDAARLTDLVGEGDGEQRVARDVNTALWAPGWGEFLAGLASRQVPGVDDTSRDAARRLFRDAVRGQGPAPAIRVGAQPYGLLPVTDLTAWQPAPGESTGGIVQLLRSLRDRFAYAVRRHVPSLPDDDDPTGTLLEILGSSPVMQGLRVRPVISYEAAEEVTGALGLGQVWRSGELVSMATILGPLLYERAGQAVPGSLHVDTRPLPLPLASERDPEVITALLETPSRVLAVDSVLQALLVLAVQSADLDAGRAAPVTLVPDLVDRSSLDDALRDRIRRVVDGLDTVVPADLFSLVDDLRGAGVTPGGYSRLLEFQPFTAVQTSLADVALAAPVDAASRALVDEALGGLLLAVGYRREVEEAMRGLLTTDVDARELAVASALDCSSHRYDAWVTAVATDRRDRQAAVTPRGLTLGAFGIVEQLAERPAATGSEGWLHAPSTRHAVAAGMLRSADLGHRPPSWSADEQGPFAIDLAASRSRRAAAVVDGVRQGQPLGALLGYRVERDLAAAGLGRLQLSLRTLAPLAAGAASDANGLDPAAARETVAATDVVDGARLLTRFAPGDPALRAALDVAPVNPYLEPGDWPALTDAEWTTVTAVLTATADTVDAVADLLLAESVVQFAGGNPARAAAAMDALAGSGTVPAELDVLEVPDPGERLVHRVLAVVGAPTTAAGWNADRPRAQVEPRLETWAQAHLGDPATVVVAEDGDRGVTLADAGVAALDVVFAASPAELEQLLRAALPSLGDTALTISRAPDWPDELRGLGQVAGLAEVLRTLVTNSHPVLPADLARPGAPLRDDHAPPPGRDLAAALPEVADRVRTLVTSLEAAVATATTSLGALPADGQATDPATAGPLVADVTGRLAPFGAVGAGDPARPLDLTWLRGLVATAASRATAARAALTRLTALAADTPPGTALETAQAVVDAAWGSGQPVLPVLATPTPTDDIAAALVSSSFPPPGAAAIRRWAYDVATVRPQVARLTEALLLERGLGHPRVLGVVQLAGDSGSPGVDRWLAGPWDPTDPWPAGGAAHVLLDRCGGAVDEIAGLVLDGWVEDLPVRPRPTEDRAGEDADPARARTGLAVRTTSASARAPQLVLSAISPDGARWTADRVRDLVRSTVDLARSRLVTLERMTGEAVVMPALYTRSASLQGEQHLDFARLTEVAADYVALRFVKDDADA